jgi:bacteriocin biosynthesis cyclodehydratase domain-containing protein
MIQYFDVFKDEDNRCFQLRTKTNSYTLEFDDPQRENIFLEVVTLLQREPSTSLKKIQNKLSNNHDKSKILDVLSILNEYELLPLKISLDLQKQNESPTHQPDIADKKQISDVILSIIGNGELTQVLLHTAKNQAFKKSQWYDYNHLTNEKIIEPIVSQSDFLLVDGNEWSPFHLELINQYALKYNKPWLYIPGLEDISMKIGPLFYGQETGCYHCLISRIKSNHDYPSFLESYEYYLRHHQKSSKPDLFPNADPAYHIIANLALLEVMKFFQEWALPATWRTLLSLDATSFKMTKHTLLKKPFCQVCKPQLAYHAAPWLEAITLK